MATETSELTTTDTKTVVEFAGSGYRDSDLSLLRHV
jgi:hypothetical protein